jgi:hypothetical protein
MGIRAISPKQRADYGCSPSDRTVICGFFNERELEIFSELIQHRCRLPVFRGDFWRYYDCVFESEDFQEMAAHIMKAHEPMAQDVEDELEQKQELAAA